MKTKLLTICLLLVTSQVFAENINNIPPWKNNHVKEIHEECMQFSDDLSYANKLRYCTCTTISTVETYTYKQVREKILKRIWTSDENFLKIASECFTLIKLWE